ncbi:uncharacterized protein [Pyrus communis]|uniref:uncharacterized protein n=1 Tax=Pyrus communis TaxID=23211 RepID=UPI0035BF40B5
MWQDLWPNTVVSHETAVGSDHCPIVVQSQPPIRKGKKPFRFEAFWAKDEECKNIVLKSWRLQGGSRDWGDLLDCIEPLISDTMNAELIKPVSEAEIKEATYQMGGMKAPGLDGFQGIFYHSYWDIIVEEILANRLKPLLSGLISPMQNAFVMDKQIQDNIGTAHELFHFLKLRKAKWKYELGIKLDMHERGVDGGLINGVHMNLTGPTISHLFFVDDTLIFLQANRQNCDNIMHILNMYCLASRQQISLHKSSVYFSRNVPPHLRTQLSSILGMPSVSDPGEYLSLPAIWGISKRQSLVYVKGKVLGKIHGWKQSSLSLAGKEVLIKAVIQAIPSDPMNLFKFPTAVCKDLDSLAARFWWGDADGKMRIHWMSWDKLGRPKCERG